MNTHALPKKAPSRSVADENPAPSGVAAVDRAMSLLAAFSSQDRALSVTELAQRTGLHKSTALRLLASLAHAGLVRKTANAQWALGPQVSRLASIYWASFRLEEIVKPEMTSLASRTRESVSFHVRQNGQRLVLYRIDSIHLLRDHSTQGDLVPLDRGAGGRVLLAFSGEHGEPYEQIRRDGYFQAHGDRIAGVFGISAPVWDVEKKLIGALTLSGPQQRIQDDFLNEVVSAANRISQALGATL